jgi:RNA polymerase primary sigma factor
MVADRVKTDSKEDALKAYYEQIKRKSLLSFDEELELSRRIQGGDERARTELIEANLRLVVKIARQFSSPDVPLIDLIQEGNMGLIRAAAKYDHARKVRFSTYASWWIKQAITRSLANKRRAIRIPHRKEESLKRIQKTFTELTQNLARTPTADEVAKVIGMKKEEIDSILEMTCATISLDTETSIESGTLMDVFEDYTYSPDKDLINECVRERTLQMLERLMEKEKQILMYRFEFFGGKKYTLKTIGEQLGISPETVRQIELRAIRKLKQDASELKDYILD